MGELKPIGSEKLQGDAKLERILELTYYQSPTNSKKSTVIVEETSTGVYAVVKEKDGYYVKKGLNENSLDYIGGLFMKNKNKFSSHNEAQKKALFLVEQEKLEEAKKYILKTPKPEVKPQEESPMPMPTSEVPPAPESTESAPEDTGLTPDTAPTGELGPEESPEPEEEYLKIIQKLTGKLQEKLQDYKEKLKSEDIKYVLNMVISGVDLDNLEESDKEEILDKFEPEEETSDETLPSDETATSDETSGEEGSVPPEEDLGEEDGIKSLEELINTDYFGDYTGAGEEDDEDFEDLSYFEDPEASKYAQSEYSKENPEESSPEEENPEEDYPEEEGLTSRTEKPIEDEPQEQTAPIPPEEKVDGDVKELDIDELTNAVNTSVKETLSNYFNQ